ncbi:nucleoside-diphosphate kinase [Paenibacillus gansuensis]|uniref:Nucleoside diphosphate kinase n=1 Tax=Paenibacillus gansuensis TaxID=306542 RepID=A0ABW5PD01_9BACL
MERTFIMIKPDGVQRGLIGEIVKRFELKGFQLVACKLHRVTKTQAEFHYEEHKGKPFFQELVSFITAGPVFAMVWEGDEIITLSRNMMGKTKVLESQPGTIRGDYALHTGTNIIHGSDSPQSAEREIGNFFNKEELVDYSKIIQRWV